MVSRSSVPPPEKLDSFKKWGIGNIMRMDRDGKNRKVYAWGIRNWVGMDFNPKDKTLWFTDDRVDGMGRIFRRANSTARTSPVRISASRTTAGSRGNIRAPSAQHGCWNRTVPVGARVMVTYLKEDGTAEKSPFAEGSLDENGEYLGRPVDVAQLRDGSILVSDDFAGALHRIWTTANRGTDRVRFVPVICSP